MRQETEHAIKRYRVAELLEAQQLAGLLLGRNGSVGWALDGAEVHVALNSERAAAAILYTPQRDYLLADRIEMPRILAEVPATRTFEPIELPWHDPARLAQLVTAMTAGGRVFGDIGLPGVDLRPTELSALRQILTLEEQTRLRELCARTGSAIETAVGEIAPGMSEYAIAGLLAEECFLRDITPVVLLIAVDERITRFRHPVPTATKLEHYAMLVLCARRHGLVASATRLIHFGPIPPELQHRAHACATVDATTIAATLPGATAGAIFAQLQAAYAHVGFPDEWRDHHQGGAAGYENREWIAVPAAPYPIATGMAFAWNPSIAGVKSEDTMLLTDQGCAILTATPNWPKMTIEVAGMTIERPAILEVD